MTKLVVMAKYPAAGAAKTRLAAGIGTERAWRLAQAFVLDLRDRLGRLPSAIETWWAHWPPGAPFGQLVGSPHVFPQRGPDLGSRMFHAMERVRGGSTGPVIVIGSDTPHLPLRAVEEADALLRAGGLDVVLGPATDGGYWLLGTRQPHPALFEDVPWSTGEVAAVTRARARRLGLSLAEVETATDVDDPGGLAALAAYVAAHPGELPRTEALLGSRDG